MFANTKLLYKSHFFLNSHFIFLRKRFTTQTQQPWHHWRKQASDGDIIPGGISAIRSQHIFIFSAVCSEHIFIYPLSLLKSYAINTQDKLFIDEDYLQQIPILTSRSLGGQSNCYLLWLIFSQLLHKILNRPLAAKLFFLWKNLWKKIELRIK